MFFIILKDKYTHNFDGSQYHPSFLCTPGHFWQDFTYIVVNSILKFLSQTTLLYFCDTTNILRYPVNTSENGDFNLGGKSFQVEYFKK